MRVTFVGNGQWSVRGDDRKAPSVLVTDYGNDYECSEHRFISEEPEACEHVLAVLKKREARTRQASIRGT